MAVWSVLHTHTHAPKVTITSDIDPKFGDSKMHQHSDERSEYIDQLYIADLVAVWKQVETVRVFASRVLICSILP